MSRTAGRAPRPAARSAAFKRKLARLEPEALPRHVAIILDGNGRWAKARGLSRSAGHRAGGENLSRLLDFFLEIQIPAVSMYAFSTENWKRPPAEVKSIWKLFDEFFQDRLEHCLELGIRVMASGDLSRLPASSRRKIDEVIRQTAAGDRGRLVANFCVNYGSQAEILHAVDEILKERLALAGGGQERAARAPVKKKELERHLYTFPLPDVDLLVRPGGESRLSNFLLWQSAYAEIYVTDTLWPDFDEEDLVDALLWFQGRHRRFGGL